MISMVLSIWLLLLATPPVYPIILCYFWFELLIANSPSLIVGISAGLGDDGGQFKLHFDTQFRGDVCFLLHFVVILRKTPSLATRLVSQKYSMVPQLVCNSQTPT